MRTITAGEAARLRQARNEVRHFERRMAEHPDKAQIIQARYERAVALLAAHRLNGDVINHDAKSLPTPIEFLNHDECPAQTSGIAERQL